MNNQGIEVSTSEDDQAANAVYESFINMMLDLGEKPADIAFGIGFALQQVSKT